MRVFTKFLSSLFFWGAILRPMAGKIAVLALLAANNVSWAQFVFDLDLTIKGTGRVLRTPYEENKVIIGLANFDDYVDFSTSLSYTNGTLVTLEAERLESSFFVGWSGACSGNQAKCVVTMDNAKSVTAIFFSYASYGGKQLRLSPSGSGSGYMSASNGVVSYICEWNIISCHYHIPDWMPQTFEIKAEAHVGSIFNGWVWSTDGCSGEHSFCTVNLEKDIESVGAVFLPLVKNSSEESCQARHFSADEEYLLDAYTAYYGRPADPEGLNYWAKELRQSNTSSIMQRFADSDEYWGNFGSLSRKELIDKIYLRVFSRNADQIGLSWYENKMATGEMTPVSVAMKIVGGAQAPDNRVITFRRMVAKHFITMSERKWGLKALPFSENELYQLMAIEHISDYDGFCRDITRQIESK